MTLIFIMTSEVTAQGHATKNIFFSDFPADFSSFSIFLSLLIFCLIAHLSHIFVLALLVHWDKVKVDFFAIFLQIFSLFFSLFLFSFLLRIYLIFLFWPCLYTKFILRIQFFKFYRHLKASGVLLGHQHTRSWYWHIQRNQSVNEVVRLVQKVIVSNYAKVRYGCWKDIEFGLNNNLCNPFAIIFNQSHTA